MTAVAEHPLAPGSAEWKRTITASKLAAVLGHSPFESPLSVWQQMKGTDPGRPQTSEQSRGHYLEPAVMAWWSDQHPEYTRVDTQVVLRRPDIPWAAATPDAVASKGLAGSAHVDPVGVEAKSAADTRGAWGKPGTDEIPLYYAFQAMWQMHLGGYQTTYVPVIGEYLEFSEYVIEYDPQIGASLERAAFEFWESLQFDDAPALDDHPATLESLRRVYSDIARDDAVYVPLDDARAYVAAIQGEKDAKAKLTAAKSRMAKHMGNARTAYVDLGDGTPTPLAIRQASSNGTPYVKPARTLPTIPTED